MSGEDASDENDDIYREIGKLTDKEVEQKLSQIKQYALEYAENLQIDIEEKGGWKRLLVYAVGQETAMAEFSKSKKNIPRLGHCIAAIKSLKKTNVKHIERTFSLAFIIANEYYKKKKSK